MPQFPFARHEKYKSPQENEKSCHNAPVSKAKLFDRTDVWMVWKHKDVCEALESNKPSVDRRTPGNPKIHEGGWNAKGQRPNVVNMDDPDHKKQRREMRGPHWYKPKGPEFHQSSETGSPTNSNLKKYMHKLVEKRIQKLQDDLVSKLATEQGVLTLFLYPEELEELKGDPSLAKNVVNECLRYQTASALNSRRAALEDTTIGGKEFLDSLIPQHTKKCDGVVCSVRSADRDEDPYENTNILGVHRKHVTRDTVGVGYGPHRCQGE
ncbi:hypothetical protein HO133_003535 [Letharia lupina]|uniref:Uncharacterized protein n=1 Tax=Letharia lupina TaxID=560253 RepID=A0A8H6F932_9LECA|nr:uncharacterized protein HO133_003535 [Letharia lupina]KAF6219710.1 hypothetical protein HO133_003535 [Letharia lupina]